MSYRYQSSVVLSNEPIAPNTYFMRLKREAAEMIAPGQFYMLRLQEGSPLLARPLSVCEIDEVSVGFCYLVAGEGTKRIARLVSGQTIDTIGPIGVGFEPAAISGRIALVSGGIGIAPFVELIKHLEQEQVTLYAGFANQPYLLEKFSGCQAIQIATDSGVVGHKGFVTELLDVSQYDVVLTCGPEAMMEKVVRQARTVGVPCFASMEKHMACGIGACLVCACKTKSGNQRCCVDGPVFSGADLLFGNEEEVVADA